MSNKRDPDLVGIQKRRRRYWLRIQRRGHPENLFNLRTDRIELAIVRAREIRRAIEEIGGDPDYLDAVKYAKHPPRYADGPHKGEVVTELLTTIAENIEEKNGRDAAKRWYDIASGKCVPLSSILEDKQKKHNLKSSRVRELEWAIKSCGLVMLQDCQTKQDAHRIVDRLLEAGEVKRSTVAAICRHMATLYQYATDVGLWERPNPFSKMQLTSDKTEKRPLQLSEYKLLLESADNERDKFLTEILKVLCHTGMRSGELLACTPSHLHNSSLDVPGTKTESAARTLPVVPDVSNILKRWAKDKQPDQKLIHEHHATIWRGVRSLYQRLSIDTNSVDLHSCRRLCATALQQTETPEATAAAYLGHAYGALSFGRYSAGPSPEQLLEAAFRVSDFLQPGGKYELAQRLRSR